MTGLGTGLVNQCNSKSGEQDGRYPGHLSHPSWLTGHFRSHCNELWPGGERRQPGRGPWGKGRTGVGRRGGVVVVVGGDTYGETKGKETCEVEVRYYELRNYIMVQK